MRHDVIFSGRHVVEPVGAIIPGARGSTEGLEMDGRIVGGYAAGLESYRPCYRPGRLRVCVARR
jgi:hypothetical protein